MWSGVAATNSTYKWTTRLKRRATQSRTLQQSMFMNDGAAFLGVNNLELLLTINDAKNLWCQKGNIISDFGRGVNEYAGFTNANLTQTTNPFKDSETEIQVNY